MACEFYLHKVVIKMTARGETQLRQIPQCGPPTRSISISSELSRPMESETQNGAQQRALQAILKLTANGGSCLDQVLLHLDYALQSPREL